MIRSLQHCHRIVVKIGTSSLIHKNGKVNLQTIDRLAYTLAALNNQDYEVVLVSSGAIGVGLDKIHLTERPAAIAEQQAIAAVGQGELLRLYIQRFSDYDTQVGQMLLTHDTFDYPVSRQHVLDTLETLLQRSIVPIINENDTVAVDEMDHRTTFGDNDQLSALVASRIDADLLLVLSDIDGLYDADPHKFQNARKLEAVTHLSQDILQAAGGSSTRFGTGGMVTKLKAAQTMMQAGKAMVLCSGADPRVILRVLAGEDVGTWFGKNTATLNA